MRASGEWLIRIAGFLIFAGAFAHAWSGLPVLLRELPAATAPNTRLAVATGWIYGSFTMLTLGTLVLFARGRAGTGDHRAVAIPLATGIAYVAYGVWALAYTGMRPHFWGFAAIGVLLLAGVALSSRREQAPAA